MNEQKENKSRRDLVLLVLVILISDRVYPGTTGLT